MIKSYIGWLCDKVAIDMTKYSRLVAILFATPFDWPGKIPLDANRASDGLQLRYDYQIETGNAVSDILTDCSVLEMMVGLSERIDGIVGEPGEEHFDKWFMEMLMNLGLDNETDGYFNPTEVSYVLQDCMRRRIDFDGSGGLFPLKYPTEDQRDLSIWDQMSCYLNENY